MIALPSTPREGAIEVAERTRARVEHAGIVDPTGEPVPVTISVGVAQLLADESFEQLVDRADRAMYSAKSAGRNRVARTTGVSLAPAAQ